MATDCNKNSRNGEQSKHFLPRFWSSTTPAFYTDIGDLLQFIMLREVQPSYIVVASIQIKASVG
jgi:hypothetical protein